MALCSNSKLQREMWWMISPYIFPLLTQAQSQKWGHWWLFHNIGPDSFSINKEYRYSLPPHPRNMEKSTKDNTISYFFFVSCWKLFKLPLLFHSEAIDPLKNKLLLNNFVLLLWAAECACIDGRPMVVSTVDTLIRAQWLLFASWLLWSRTFILVL